MYDVFSRHAATTTRVKGAECGALGSVAEVGWIRQLMRESVGDSRSSWRIFQHDLDAKVSPCGRTPLSWNSFMSGGAGMGTAGELSDGSPRRPELLSASVGDRDWWASRASGTVGAAV